jgi:hypothetical protein
VKREWDAADSREIRCAAAIGEGPSVARGVVRIEQVLQPDIETVPPLGVEEIAPCQVDDGVVTSRDAAEP